MLGLEPYYSSARAVNKEPSIRSSRKFQGWNSRVPAVEFVSSSSGTRQYALSAGGEYDAPRRRSRTHGATRDWLHGDLQADTFMIVLQPTPATFRYSFDYITLGGYPHGLPPSTSSRNDEAGNMFYKGYSCVFSTTIPSSRLMVRVA